MPRRRFVSFVSLASLAAAAVPGCGVRAASRAAPLPIRPEEAPIVTVRDVINGKVPLGSRVRVTGRCVAAGTGRDAGLWTLLQDSMRIEVRGLVPKKCPGSLAEPLTIFAQVEWISVGRAEPLLLRLPG